MHWHGDASMKARTVPAVGDARVMIGQGQYDPLASLFLRARGPETLSSRFSLWASAL